VAQVSDAASVPSPRPLVERAINRGLADQYAQAADEVRRIIDATYRVIEREGAVEPRIRAILAEAGLATQAFYRHFASKDELLLVILDDGRRKLADYLVHRMDKAAPRGAVARIRAWIEGILAQAADPAAAARTRPFISGLQRLAELYPEEQQASVDLLVDILRSAVQAAVDAGELPRIDVGRSAYHVYSVSVAVMEDHLLRGTTPARADTRELVGFCLRALGAGATG
jgi:AcrR family transcriptional regulator